jgi:CelD/BcsL family acetyltransferase involved in cellulose biosynthesis
VVVVTTIGPLSLAVLTEPADLHAMRVRWGELLERSATNQPTQSPLWILQWWKTFGSLDGRQLRACLFFDGPRLVGLAPLLVRQQRHAPGMTLRRLELLGSGESQEDEIYSEYLNPIAEPGYEEPVARALVRGLGYGLLGAWDEVMLQPLDGDAPIAQALASAFVEQGHAVASDELSPSRYATLPGRWEDYLGGLASQDRYMVKRSLRDFDTWAAGQASLERVTSAAELPAGIDILMSLHEQRWRADSEAGVFASPRFKAFHLAVLPELLARGALELIWLRVREQPVAVAYNIIWNNKVHFYQGGRAMDLPKGIRPGIVLHTHAIRGAIAAGRHEYDFLGGPAQYKRQMGPKVRKLLALRVVRPLVRETVRRLALSGQRWWRARRQPVPALDRPAGQRPGFAGDTGS